MTEQTAPNKLLDTVRARVERFLRDMGPYEVTGNNYRIHMGSAMLQLEIHPFANSKPFIRLICPLLRGVTKAGNEAMFEEFLRHNSDWIFGKIYWLEMNDTPGQGIIFIEHCLLGEFLDYEELLAGIQCLINLCDEQDEVFQAKFGGQRWADD